MKAASEIFTLDELMFDVTRERTGETRKRDSDVIAPYTEERVIVAHPDGRQGEEWQTVS